MRTLRWVAIAGAALTLVAAACTSGTEDEIVEASGRVDVVMRDNSFEPDRFMVERGEEVTFRFMNRGRIAHDAFIGDEHAQEEHEQEMAEMRQMGQMGHGDDHEGTGEGGITVEPGETGTIKHRFDEAGEYRIGCHQPGHYAAGMVATITVR